MFTQLNASVFLFNRGFQRTGIQLPDLLPTINLVTPTSAARFTRQKEKGMPKIRGVLTRTNKNEITGAR